MAEQISLRVQRKQCVCPVCCTSFHQNMIHQRRSEHLWRHSRCSELKWLEGWRWKNTRGRSGINIEWSYLTSPEDTGPVWTELAMWQIADVTAASTKWTHWHFVNVELDVNNPESLGWSEQVVVFDQFPALGPESIWMSAPNELNQISILLLLFS